MRNNYLITKKSGIPLIGVHVFGIIDRGNNLLQVRPVSGCVLNCIFCSVDEGALSRKLNTYEVECDYLVQEINKVVEYKGVNDVEVHIDGVGEPLLYKDIVNLVKGIRKNKDVKVISMQTHGTLLSSGLIKDLADARLDRINLSIDSLNPETAKILCGNPSYDIEKIKKCAEEIVKSGIKLMITPVIVPGYNDSQIGDLINFAKKIGASLGIQKYERQKHGRRLKVKEETWYRFNKWLKELEKKYDVNLLLSEKDFNLYRCKSLPIRFEKGDLVRGNVVLPGWLSNEVIIKVNDRLVTVFNSDNKVGDAVKARIVKTKHNLYLANNIVKL
ncbi:Coenzyme PQQ synthesis protein E [Candidatus Tiddalikarchaeum anstoanum]|nr:Coenzyme PQQ synthesis protein E [Candidatus Tiddalikarchaeum anstoanum]